MSGSYQSGVHVPVHSERTDANLPVWGQIPEDLSGMFVRNSANPKFTPPGRYHWFDGDGMVHGVRLGDGKASYLNRWIRTPGLEAEEAAGKALWSGILEPPDLQNPLGPLKDTANTHLVRHGDHLLATWWLSGRPQRLDLGDLSTAGPPPFLASLGRRTVAAHPKVDPRTGELLFMGYGLVKAPWYWVGVVDPAGNLLRVEDIEVGGARIPHDIGITENYVVILDLPLGWDRGALAKGKRRITFAKDEVSRFGLWPRKGGPVRWFEVPSCYIYHLTSSFEEGGKVVVTGCRIDDPIPEEPDQSGWVAKLDLIHLVPVSSRWTLDLATGAVSVETLDDHPTEFPRVDDRRWGQPTRFAYHPRIARQRDLAFEGFQKLDHQTGSVEVFDYPPGWLSGEVVFAPKAGRSGEDEGYVVTTLSHPDVEHSETWVIDAQDLSGGPVAKITLPWRIPLGFHADWVTTPQL